MAKIQSNDRFGINQRQNPSQFNIARFVSEVRNGQEAFMTRLEAMRVVCVYAPQPRLWCQS